MILTTHAVVGASVASLFAESPAVGFVAAFASHFVLDTLPHWDYAIKSDSINPKIGSPLKFDKNLVSDVLTIGSDLLIGAALSSLIFIHSTPLQIILMGVFAGVLPDALQLLYTRLKYEPLLTLQRFHVWIQKDRHVFKTMPWVGVLIQVVLIAFCILLIVGDV